MGNLQRFIEIGDSSGVGTIWTCCITCLGHLVALCHLVSRTEPTLRGSMDDLCDLTLDKLANLSHGVHIEEYSHFDVLTGVWTAIVLLWMREGLIEDAKQMSWKRALDTVEMRIRSCSHAESGSLWCWKEVIKKAYVDLQAKLARCGPSPLAALAMSEDGRTKESSFPNLFLHTEREPYGL